jgi:hypothetical protein
VNVKFWRKLTTDDGFTLSELAVYGLLLGLVVSTAAGILISGSVSERTVRTVVGASTESQLVADSIETGIRNASAYALTSPSTGTQLLRARVAQGTAGVQWNCAAWYYTPNMQNGSVWYKSSNTAIANPTTANINTWILLADDIKPISGSSTIFTIGANQLTFSFEAEAGNDPPASVTSSATSRTSAWESAPCF